MAEILGNISDSNKQLDKDIQRQLSFYSRLRDSFSFINLEKKSINVRTL